MNCGAATDTGLHRASNEDRYWIDAERGIFLVVDGVGGHAGGQTAAHTAVEEIRQRLMDVQGTPEERVRDAITSANNRIFDLAQESTDRRGMACVLTLALVEDGNVTIGHVGDSRLYLVWHGALRKMTSDHSPVGEEEDAGELTEDEAMRHPRRHQIFRDVGSQRRGAGDPAFIEIRQCRLRPDAALLLCSDGLTDQVPAARLREVIESYDGDAARIAGELVEAANRAGGRDNATALFVAGAEFRGRTGATRARFSTTRLRPARLLTGRMAFLAYGVLIGMLVWAVLRGVRG